MAKCLVGANGGGKLIVEGLSAETLVADITAVVKQGSKVVKQVTGGYRVLAVHGGNLGAIVPRAVIWKDGKYTDISVSKQKVIEFDGTPLYTFGVIAYEQVTIGGKTYTTSQNGVNTLFEGTEFSTNSFVYNTTNNAVATFVVLGIE